MIDMKFQFGNVVVVDNDMIGVIIKSWENRTHWVWVREYNAYKDYHEKEIRHYVYSKQLSEDEWEFYR